MDRLISCEFNMDTACVELKICDRPEYEQKVNIQKNPPA